MNLFFNILFVVVWREGHKIIGQMLSDEGNIVGDPLVIVSGTASGDPTLAYNDQTAEFLVVWPDNRNISIGEEDIFGQLIKIQGKFLVTIDIKPGSDPNSILCTNEKGVIAVAILTTDDFDATTVDHTTVTFEGASETHVNKKSGESRRHEQDVDRDGDIDLMFHFRLGDTDLTCGSTEGKLTGETFDGQLIQGTDSVNQIPPYYYTALLHDPDASQMAVSVGLLSFGLFAGLALVFGSPAKMKRHR